MEDDLIKLTNLESLTNRETISCQHLTSLVGLKRLKIGGCREIGDHLRTLTNLTHLKIKQHALTSASSILQLINLEELDLRETTCFPKFADDGSGRAEIILPKLRKLSCHSDTFGSESNNLLSRLTHLTRLKVMRYKHTDRGRNITDEGLKHLVNLEYLDTTNIFSNNDISQLAKLKHLRLRVDRLNDLMINMETFEKLSRIEKFSLYANSERHFANPRCSDELRSFLQGIDR
jgi:hypothetical protein